MMAGAKLLGRHSEKLDLGIAEAIERARVACEERDRRLGIDPKAPPTAPPRTGHDMSNMSREDRKQLYADAKTGLAGWSWRRVANFKGMTVGKFLAIWSRFKDPPPDKYFESIWPGWRAPK